MELDYLLYSGILLWVMLLTASGLRTRAFSASGMWLALQNRDNLPPETAAAGRGRRAAMNMLENYVLFAVVVLAASAQNVSNESTQFGALLFFWARLAYFPLYVIGIPVLRTLSWAVALAGIIIILVEIL
jgi:uncharacterized MAPEG superfamily protein